MEITLFGRTFYFLTERRQFEKLFDYVYDYWFSNPISIFSLILMLSITISILVLNRASKNSGLQTRRSQQIHRILLALYTLALYLLLVISRDTGTREWRHIAISDYLAGDSGFHESEILIAALYILYFIPFGILLRKVIPSQKKWQSILLILACTSAFGIFIELSQYILARGITYIGHILAYTIGALLGSFGDGGTNQ